MLPYVPDGDDDADLDDRRRRPAPAIPKSVVIDPAFDWEDDDGSPAHAVERDGHLRGARQGLHEAARRTCARTCAAPTPGSRPRTRSRTCSRSASPRSSCCRCTTSPTRASSLERGLTNYWGYSSIGYLAPHSLLRRRRGEQVREFKGMVKALHRAGHRGDPRRRLQPHRRGQPPRPDARVPRHRQRERTTGSSPDDPRYYMDYTGTGNRLNPVHPSVLRLIMDSLRYFVIECHVDGFRFDLASALAREFHEVDRLSAFFDIIHQDPMLSQVKLIAEPWDVGEGGYQVGNFPILWTEWNGIYRDTMRDFWRGAGAASRDFAVALRRLGRPLRARRPPAVRVDQLRHRARRLHARRPRLVQREAQRGEPRGQPRRHRRQPLLELRRRGPDRRPRGQRAARAPAAQLPRDAAALAGRADAARRRRDRAARRAATTTRTARTTRSRGSTGSDGDQRAARVHAPADRAAARAPGVPPHDVLRGARASGLPDVWWFRPDGRRMTRRDWDNAECARARRVPQRRRAPTRRRRTASEVRDDSFLCSSTRTTRTIDVPPARAALRHALGARPLDRPTSSGDAARAAARTSTVESALDRRASAVRVSRSRATYRLQLTPELGFAQRARARAVPARARHLATSTCRRPAGARGLDARLRRRRPAPRLRRARRRGRVPRARRRGPRRDPRHRPEPHGGGRREPVLARPRRCARCSSTSTCRPASTAASSTSASSPACGRRTRRCSGRRTRR